MRLWGIADTHLSFGTDKPMDIFGDRWADHAERLCAAWLEQVAPEDTVLIPGDISWGMTLEEAAPDLRFLHELPGTKYLSRGNHDYWWATMRKMERFAEAHDLHSLRFMKNDAHRIPLAGGRHAVIAGSRGWTLPSDQQFNEQDQKIYDREVMRLGLSFDEAKALREPGDLLICALHYPPMTQHGERTPIAERIEAEGVDLCVFGHVHGIGARYVYEGTRRGVRYLNIASDHLAFRPKELA